MKNKLIPSIYVSNNPNSPRRVGGNRVRVNSDGISILCDCCDRPFARVTRDGTRLVILSIHNLEQHTNALELAGLPEIIKLLTLST